MIGNRRLSGDHENARKDYYEELLPHLEDAEVEITTEGSESGKKQACYEERL